MNEIAKKEETALVQTPTPMDMIQMAIQQGTSPEQLSQLMDLQERWEAKEAKKAFIMSLAKFRKDCPDIIKDTKGHNCKYATLAGTLSAISGTMENCELSHTWETDNEGQDVKVTCILTHILGHSQQATLTAGIDTSGSKQPIQGVGSTVSYLQRYTLYSVLGITSKEMDNNGDGAMIDEKQKQEIIDLIKETKSNTVEFLNYAGVQSVDEIPAHKFDRAIAILKNRKKK
jgi:hypothetical protein